MISDVRICGLGGASEAVSGALWVRSGRIQAVGEAAEGAPAAVPRIDGGGRFAVPGLIDAHVHLELDPTLRTPAEQLARPREARAAAMATRARRMLLAGVTTTRDCGGGEFLEHALRAEIEAGRLPGPRILCCGRPLTSPGGHCHFWGGEVHGPADIDTLLARNVEAGSDWIKVMATGGVFTPGSRARDRQFEFGRLATIVEAASRAGRPVAAHCHGTAGIADALRAGVRTIEHASFAGPGGFGVDLDPALMREMAAREVWVSPTVNAGWNRRVTDDAGAPTDFFRRMSRCLRDQRAAGVRFIASTDAGIPGVDHADFVGGLEAFAHFADLSPAEALESATAASARALGLEAETGRLEPGLSADLLLLDRDPLADLSALRDPAVVVARGVWHDRATSERGRSIA